MEEFVGTIDLLIEHGAPPAAIASHCYHMHTTYSSSYEEVAPSLRRANLVCLHRAVGMDGIDERECAGMHIERPGSEVVFGEEVFPAGDDVKESCEGCPVAGGDGYSYSRAWPNYNVSNMITGIERERRGF